MYRVLGYVSKSANFEVSQINNRLEGGDEKVVWRRVMKVCTLRGRGYLENVRKRTRGRGSKNR